LEGLDWVNATQDTKYWRVDVQTVMIIRV
jgi:hypothetical protein